LRSLPNALLTGHVGYVTRDLYTIFYRDAEEDIAAFQAGSPIRLIEQMTARKPLTEVKAICLSHIIRICFTGKETA